MSAGISSMNKSMHQEINFKTWQDHLREKERRKLHWINQSIS